MSYTMVRALFNTPVSLRLIHLPQHPGEVTISMCLTTAGVPYREVSQTVDIHHLGEALKTLPQMLLELSHE
jgi:hypothetical protein